MEDQQPDLLSLSTGSEQSERYALNGVSAAEYFSTAELTQRLDLLCHMTQNSDRIPLVIAPEGAGKSRMLQQYQQQAHDSWELCTIEANSMLQPDQLFHMLSRRFAIPGEQDDSVEQLLYCFSVMRSQGLLPIIAIDDAHMLPVSTIIALLRLHERRPDSEALVRIVLFSTPQIRDQLQTPQIQAMNLQQLQELDLPRFDQAQSIAFIHFLLRAQGADRGSAAVLPVAALHRIEKAGQGLPGLLEKQLTQLLCEGAGEQTAASGRSLFSDLPRPVFFGGAVLLLVLLGSLIFQQQINALFNGSEMAPAALKKTERTTGIVPLALPPPQLPKRLPAEIDGPGRLSGLIGEDAPSDDTDQAALRQAERSDGDRPEQPEMPAVTGEEAGPVLQPVVEIPAPMPLVAPEGSPTRTAATAVARIELPLVTAAPPAAPVIEPQAETPLQPEREKAIAPVSAPAQIERSKPAQPVAASVATEVRREAWIRQQEPAAYTLQLIGVGEEQAAMAFIQRYALPGPTAYFMTLRDGHAWYSVVNGLYKDRDAALKASQSLPEALIKGGAWPRSMASIQQAIKE